MAVSQNGWTTIDGTNLDKSPIPGTSVVPVPGLRPGDVATVLLEVGKQFNETVAPVYNPGCWGWNAPTPIPGSTILSNHGSGTAIDFNAPSFPWQKRTMSDAQRQACRVIVNHMGGLVAWGGDFTTTVDEMHFEINGSVAEIASLAEQIRNGGDDVKFTKEQYIVGAEAVGTQFGKDFNYDADRTMDEFVQLLDGQAPTITKEMENAVADGITGIKNVIGWGGYNSPFVGKKVVTDYPKMVQKWIDYRSGMNNLYQPLDKDAIIKWLSTNLK